MSKPKNHRKPWKTSEINILKDMAKKKKPTTAMAKKLGRTEAAIRAKANKKRIGLSPAN